MPIFSRIWTHPQTGLSDPDQLQRNGPALPVEISVPARLATFFSQQGKNVPQPVSGLALVDTGASITAVDVTTLTGLGLNPVGTVQVLTPQGQAMQGLYACRISFPGTPPFLP